MSQSPGPRTLRLRRGVPVLARSSRQIQVGVDPDRRVLVPRSPAAERWLDELAHGAAEPDDPVLQPLVSRLVSSGLVVVEPEQAHRARARDEARTRLLGPPGWCSELVRLLAEHGLTHVATADEPLDHPPDLTVLLTVGEPSRQLVDELTWGGDPLLLAAAVDSRVRLGPFVLPGSTACLRCLDAHLDAADPARAVVPEATLPPPTRPGPVELSDLLLAHLLLGVVAEVAAWAEGRLPRTCSATTWLDEELVEEHREWRRHPRCGCTWEDLLLPG
ncbi:hypothetical protein [Nocardioides solisilvae]|uniref:hypothetical protein n=1 Tax=Nocardioides solisilvae TaxID=1542435 RepID=UPI000D749B28|nr:hypothetical protein [Nocardioides solisilvae]